VVHEGIQHGNSTSGAVKIRRSRNTLVTVAVYDGRRSRRNGDILIEKQNWVLRLFGEGDDRYIQRLSRKRIGGDSFSAGWRYELAYNVHIVVIELAKLLEAYRDQADMEAINRCYIDQSPNEFVDDLKIKSLTDEMLVQLKSGRIDWVSVVLDFKLQRLQDVFLSRDIKYRLVNGSAKSLADLNDQVRKRKLSAEGELFHYPQNFLVYLAQHPDASSALQQLTGSTNKLDQETAYRALQYVVVGGRGKLSFVKLLENAARRVYDFLSPLEKYDTHKYLEHIIRDSLPDVEPRVSGRLLHLEDAGLLQTFVIPSVGNPVERIHKWLADQDDPLVETFTEALRHGGWHEVDRSDYG